MTTPQRRSTTFALATGTLFASFISALVLSSTSTGVGAREVKLPARAAQTVVHQLPRVVISGQVRRVAPAPVVELPRVVVTGRRSEVLPTLVTEAARQAAPRS